MYDIGNKQYIFKLSNGKILNIFYKEGSGIYISTMNKRNFWVEPSPLVRDTNQNFSADIDDNDNIYILFQDKHGNILQGFYNYDRWTVKPVLNSSGSQDYNKHLQVLCLGDSIYYFYILEYSGNKLLSYQVQNRNGSISTPKVIDYISESVIPYKVTKDLNNNIYIFYKSNDAKNSLIGCKKYNQEDDRWDEFKAVSTYTGNSDIIAAIADSKNNMHIIMNNKLSDNYCLVHTSKPLNSETWSAEKRITTSQKPFYNSSLFSINDMLICFWIKDNTIYYSTVMNNNDIWSKQEKYSFFENKPLYCIIHKSNILDESQTIIYNDLPATFSGGYKLAFINDANLKPGLPNHDEFRSILSDTLKDLSANLENINNLVIEIKNKLNELESRQTHIEAELSKLSIKSSLIDNDLSSLKLQANPQRRLNVSDSTTHNTTKANYSNFSNPNVDKVIETPQANNAIADGKTLIHKNENNFDNGKKQIPIMPGTGFASITPEFLQSLSKK